MNPKIQQTIQQIITTVEPLQDSMYGLCYRCSLTLKDDTELPCVVIHSRKKLVELAKRRIRDEIDGQGYLGGVDPYEQIVSLFVTGGNRDKFVGCVTAKHNAPNLMRSR